MSQYHRHKQRCRNGRSTGDNWITKDRYLDDLFEISYQGFYVCNQRGDDIETFNIVGPFKSFSEAQSNIRNRPERNQWDNVWQGCYISAEEIKTIYYVAEPNENQCRTPTN